MQKKVRSKMLTVYLLLVFSLVFLLFQDLGKGVDVDGASSAERFFDALSKVPKTIARQIAHYLHGRNWRNIHLGGQGRKKHAPKVGCFSIWQELNAQADWLRGAFFQMTNADINGFWIMEHR